MLFLSIEIVVLENLGATNDTKVPFIHNSMALIVF